MEEKKAIKETFEEYSAHYEESMESELNRFWGWSYATFLDELINRTPIQQNQKVLDIATGTAMIPRKISSKNIPGIHITGLDLTEAMLVKGKSEIQKMDGSNSITLTCGDAMALPFPSQTFDVVLSGLASHHMSIPLMLSEKKRVLKPGGVLSIIDIGMSPFWKLPIIQELVKVIVFFVFLFQKNPVRAWAEAAAMKNTRTPEGWKAELEEAGFEDIRIAKLSSKYSWIPEPLTIQSTYRTEKA
jgi:demethylmenaquinone methyltransferase/2-methoxy-6-polyprenyl-1,4-benzoquinol methylase